MKFNFKRLFSVLLSICIFSNCFCVFAMESLLPEESIDSIVRDETSSEDEGKIREALNRSIKKGTGIVGGGVHFFEPYTFHKNEPRKVCVYTIPYLLDDRCPVLRELVNMLWSTVDASKDLSKIDKGFISQTQRFLDDFNSISHVSASYLDLYGAISSFMEEQAHPADRENAKRTMGSVVSRISEKWKEFNKPVVSENMTAMNLLLKLYRYIGGERYRSATGFHNVFVMAYDTGEDNSNFFKKLLKKTRPLVPTCVAFTSVDGLHKSTTYNEAAFETGYKYLYNKIQEELARFFSSTQSAPSAGIAQLQQEVAAARQEAEAAKRTAEAVKQDVVVVKQDLENLKLTVDEIKHEQEEHAKFNELTESVARMGEYIRKMSSEGSSTVNDEEAKRVFQKVEDSMRVCYSSSEEADIPAEIKALRDLVNDTRQHVAKHVAAIRAINEQVGDVQAEMSGVHDSIKDTRQHVAKHAEDIITLKGEMSDMQAEMSEAHEAFDYFVKARAEWEKRAIEIADLTATLKRDEERLMGMAKDGAKELIWEQYKKSSGFQRWRLRKLFPFLSELESQRKK